VQHEAFQLFLAAIADVSVTLCQLVDLTEAEL